MSIAAINPSLGRLYDTFNRSHCSSFFLGFRRVSTYLSMNGTSNEYGQGANDYLTYSYKGAEFIAISGIIKEFASGFFNYKKFNPKVPCYFNYGLTIAQISAIPIGFILAYIKETAAKESKVNRHYCFHLLEKCTPSFSTFSKAALLTSLVSTLYFNPVLFVSGFGLRWLYYELKTHGYIPVNIANYLEDSYFAKVAIAALDITQLSSGFSLRNLWIGCLILKEIFPTQFSRLIFFPIHILQKKIMAGNGAGHLVSYKELTDELTVKEHSNEDLISILIDGEDRTINPAHCSKDKIPDLVQDYNFKKLLDIFKKTNWEEIKTVVDLKVKNDDRFNEEREKNENIKNIKSELTIFSKANEDYKKQELLYSFFIKLENDFEIQKKDFSGFIKPEQDFEMAKEAFFKYNRLDTIIKYSRNLDSEFIKGNKIFDLLSSLFKFSLKDLIEYSKKTQEELIAEKQVLKNYKQECLKFMREREFKSANFNYSSFLEEEPPLIESVNKYLSYKRGEAQSNFKFNQQACLEVLNPGQDFEAAKKDFLDFENARKTFSKIIKQLEGFQQACSEVLKPEQNFETAKEILLKTINTEKNQRLENYEQIKLEIVNHLKTLKEKESSCLKRLKDKEKLYYAVILYTSLQEKEEILKDKEGKVPAKLEDKCEKIKHLFSGARNRLNDADKVLTKVEEKNGFKTPCEWMKDQFSALINLSIDYHENNKLTSYKGNAKDMEQAMKNMAIINAYILELDKKGEKLEIQDILLKLAVEGGKYCARGIKRATEQIVNSIQSKKIEEGMSNKPEEQDANRDFETFLWFTLLNMRKDAIATFKQNSLDEQEEFLSLYFPAILVQIFTRVVGADIHANDVVDQNLKPGFIPGSGDIDFVQEISVNKTIRSALFMVYQKEINTKFFEKGYKVNEAAQYLIRYSKGNRQIKNFLTVPPNNLSPEEFNERVFKAVFSIMGVYN